MVCPAGEGCLLVLSEEAAVQLSVEGNPQVLVIQKAPPCLLPAPHTATPAPPCLPQRSLSQHGHGTGSRVGSAGKQEGGLVW